MKSKQYCEQLATSNKQRTPVARCRLLVASTFFFTMLIFTNPTPASAEDKPFEVSGYTKTLSTFTQSAATGEEFYAILNRLRLEVKKELDPWTFYVAMDNEALLHDAESSAELAFIRSRAQSLSASWDWDKTSVDDQHLYLRHSIYRAYVQYYDPKFQATLGKQGIDWGVMRFYSPNDIFNTVGPIDLEYDERVGVDAVNINWAIDDFTGINAVVVPDGDDEDFMAALKAYKTINTYDFSIIAALVRSHFLAGITFDGYLKKAGFRGELQYVEKDNDEEFIRASVGLDYTFNEKFYMLFEQFHNGGASDSFAVTTTTFLSSLEFMSTKKNLSSLWVQYTISPLLEWNNYIIYDWDGKSIVYNPELQYDVTENTELKAGIQAAYGEDNSEWGDVEHLFYVQLQWFF